MTSVADPVRSPRASSPDRPAPRPPGPTAAPTRCTSLPSLPCPGMPYVRAVTSPSRSPEGWPVREAGDDSQSLACAPPGCPTAWCPANLSHAVSRVAVVAAEAQRSKPASIPTSWAGRRSCRDVLDQPTQPRTAASVLRPARRRRRRRDLWAVPGYIVLSADTTLRRAGVLSPCQIDRSQSSAPTSGAGEISPADRRPVHPGEDSIGGAPRAGRRAATSRSP
jgi:hypothetical protein